LTEYLLASVALLVLVFLAARVWGGKTLVEELEGAVLNRMAATYEALRTAGP
jgi:hypothetical protein